MGTPWGDQPPLVYFAEPIDKAHGQNFAIAATMHGALTTWGCTTYRPSAAWKATHLDWRVDHLNRQALRLADLIVAYLDEHTPSIGVPAEIEAATAQKIPAIVHYTGTSFVLAGNPLVTVITKTEDLVAAVMRALKDHPRPDRAADHQLARTLASGGSVSLGTITPAQATALVAKINGPEPIRLVVTEGAAPPQRVYQDDAGIDLTTAAEIVINPGQYVDVPTQVEATQLPSGYWGLITGRSSALRKWRLHIPIAVIDPGWRGPLFVGVWNLGGNPVTVKAGDRLGQLILIPNHTAPIEVVAAVEDHPRGLKGFGSSG
jgi:dUTP pyrophosphatase